MVIGCIIVTLNLKAIVGIAKMPESLMVAARVALDWQQQIHEIANAAGRKKAEVVEEAIAQDLVKGAIDDQNRVATQTRKLGRLVGLVGSLTMRTAVFLVLPTTLILCTNYGAQAQLGVTSGNSLVLVKGDTPNSPTPSCSFISATVLRPVPIVQGLLFVQRGDPPDQVEAKMPFPPDQPYANDVLEWTATRGGNYIRAVVNFRNKSVLTRSFTMATNYKQPNEKQCQWEVQEEEQGTQQDSPLQPDIQNNPANQVNNAPMGSYLFNTSRSGSTQNGKLIEGNVSYPTGSRINADGIISTPRGKRTIPSVSITRLPGTSAG